MVGTASDPGSSGWAFSCETLFWKHVNLHLKGGREEEPWAKPLLWAWIDCSVTSIPGQYRIWNSLWVMCPPPRSGTCWYSSENSVTAVCLVKCSGLENRTGPILVLTLPPCSTELTHSSVLAWRIPGTAEPGGLPSMGSHRVGHNWSDLAAAAAAELWESPFPLETEASSIRQRWVFKLCTMEPGVGRGASGAPRHSWPIQVRQDLFDFFFL